MEFFIQQTVSSKALSKYKVPELKNFLRSRKLKVSGKKSELIKRINRECKTLHTTPIPISQEEFENLCNSWGIGIYRLCIRGDEIKGNKVLNTYQVEEDTHSQVFNAETIAVNQKLSLSQLNNGELVSLLGSMIKNAPSDAEGQNKFINDLGKFHSEISSRGLNTTQAAEPDTLVSAGLPISSSVTPFLLGALTGGVIVYAIQKKEINELNTQIKSLQDSVQEAEQAIEGIKHKAETLSAQNQRSPDEVFLSEYNLVNRLRP